MATTIKIGDIIIAQNVRTGTSKHGEYFMCRVGEKATDRIIIWANDASLAPKVQKLELLKYSNFAEATASTTTSGTPTFPQHANLRLSANSRNSADLRTFRTMMKNCRLRDDLL